MLTVVILLAFLSMSEALSRQGYLLVPEKAETADPAHAPRLFSCWLIMCVRVLATCCVNVSERMLNGFQFVHICIRYEVFCVCVCVTGSPEQGTAVGQRPPVQTPVPGGGV